MNLLTDQLPEAVLVGGVETRINTDFRACLRVIFAFEDPDLADAEKQAVLLANLYPDPVADVSGAYEVGVRFLDGGSKSKDGDSSTSPRVFSWEQDQALIYSAFMQTHGIDLATATMHWWKFLALFMDLGADTAFCQLAAMRKRLRTGAASKEEKKIAREDPERFYLKELDTRTLEEREQEDEFLRLVEEGRRRRDEARKKQ